MGILGLPGTAIIIPDTSQAKTLLPVSSLQAYLDSANRLRPSLASSTLGIDIAKTNVRLAKSTRMPQLSIYAGDALQRPFLYTLQPLNVYANAYQAGATLKYDISSLYNARDRIRLAKVQEDQQRTLPWRTKSSESSGRCMPR